MKSYAIVYNKSMTKHNVITLDNATAQRITPPGIHSGMDITLQNVSSSGYIYIGGEGVSTTNYGYRLVPNSAISFELPPKDALFAIASAPGLKLSKLEMGLESQK
jgi:hypothetical protein